LVLNDIKDTKHIKDIKDIKDRGDNQSHSNDDADARRPVGRRVKQTVGNRR
jgi:hypothetical protein